MNINMYVCMHVYINDIHHEGLPSYQPFLLAVPRLRCRPHRCDAPRRWIRSGAEGRGGGWDGAERELHGVG